MRALQATQMKLKDKRIKCISELLNGIKVIKLNAWEESFQRDIVHIRHGELRNLINQALMRAITWFVFSMAPFLVSLVSFAAYVLLGNHLDARKAFVSLALFNILRYALLMLPMAIANTVQAYVSVHRIQRYLAADELNPAAVGRLPNDSADAVRIVDGTFRWTRRRSDAWSLRSITMSIGQGQLVAVVGSVGAGKSSLCSAILGQMERVRGSVALKGCGKVAYVAQQAWLQNASVRENITFSRPFDQRRYRAVLDACALQADLAALPAGDATEIGERGINLSGGQKQRVALARAIYASGADDDLYIMDDPLAAVDAHVGRHIFDRVLSSTSGLLRNRTRLFVTNSVGFLPKCDCIVVLRDGEISEVGTYRQLLDANAQFAVFLNEHVNDDDDETLDDDELEELKRRGFGRQSEILCDARRPPSRTPSARSEPWNSSRSSLDSIACLRGAKPSSVDLAAVPPTGAAGQLIQVEETATGVIKFQVYALFARYLTIVAVVGTIVAHCMWCALHVCSSIWLSRWSSDVPTGDGEADLVQSQYRIATYSLLGCSQALFILVAYMLSAYGTISASRKLHNSMLSSIIKVRIVIRTLDN